MGGKTGCKGSPLLQEHVPGVKLIGHNGTGFAAEILYVFLGQACDQLDPITRAQPA